MNIRQLTSAAVLAVSAMLAACGGGDSTQAGINGGGLTGGGSSEPAIAVGGITAFGSIFVNGIEFDVTNSTAVTVDGVLSSGQTDLRVGQIVIVRGTINQSTGRGTATSVEYQNSLRGNISSIGSDPLFTTFNVAGQLVTVTPTTVFEGFDDFADLSVNDGVEVSAFVSDQGSLVASRVEATGGIVAGQWELSGVVSALSGFTFNIGTTLVNINSQQAVGLANELCVEVKGTFNGSALFANQSIKVESCRVSGADRQVGEVEGIVANLAAGAFKVGSVDVSTNGSTRYENGIAANLANGRAIEVEGTFNASGVLVASTVKFKLSTDIRMSGLVDTNSVNVAAGTFRMFGVTVTANDNTIFVDKTMNNPDFSVGDLVGGDFLEVRGDDNQAHSAMTAVTLERRSPENRYEIRAIASSVVTTNTVFRLFGGATPGINVETSGITGSMPPGFFNASTNDDLVRVRGDASSAWTAPPTFMANDVEIEEAR